MRIFGIDPGSERTGFGCVESDGRRHQLVTCGAITALAGDAFPQRLARIHRQLTILLSSCQPDCVAVESLFHAANARSALKLGHARGVALLAAVEAGCEIVEYTPAEVKRAVVGYGRAEKQQVGQMIKLLLGLQHVPTPHDASDALAVAICHLHSDAGVVGRLKAAPTTGLKAAPTNRLKATNGLRAARTGDTGGTVDAAADGAGADVGAAFRRPATRPPKSWRQYRPPTNG